MLEVNYKEGDIEVRNLYCQNEIEEALKLRYGIFTETLKWTEENSQRIETDEFDDCAVHFGVFDRGRLVSYMRLILPVNKFMMEAVDIFRPLIPGKLENRDTSAEISRFCTRNEKRVDTTNTQAGKMFYSLCLSKGVYLWCKLNKIKHLYAITEFNIYRLFKKYGFPFKEIGVRRYKMSDVSEAVLMKLDWQEYEVQNEGTDNKFFQWFTEYPQYQLSHAGSPLQQPVTCLQHQA